MMRKKIHLQSLDMFFSLFLKYLCENNFVVNIFITSITGRVNIYITPKVTLGIK